MRMIENKRWYCWLVIAGLPALSVAADLNQGSHSHPALSSDYSVVTPVVPEEENETLSAEPPKPPQTKDQTTHSSGFSTYNVKPLKSHDDDTENSPTSLFEGTGTGLVYKPQAAPSAALSLGRPNPDAAFDPDAPTDKLKFDKTITDDFQVGVEYHIPY